MCFRESQPESKKHSRILAGGLFQEGRRAFVVSAGRIQSPKVEDRALVLRIDSQHFFKLRDRLSRAISSCQQHTEIRQRTHKLRFQTQRSAVLFLSFSTRATLIENHSEQTVRFGISWMSRENLARRRFCFSKSTSLHEGARITQQRIGISRSTLRRTGNRERDGKQK